MTPGGESMLRVKELLVPATGEKPWRRYRAGNLALMIAWHRRSLGRPGRAFTKRIILEDIIPDCGWPRLAWLKPRVRAEMARIEENMSAWGNE